MPSFSTAGAPRRTPYVVPPGGSTGLAGSPCRATVTTAPPNGLRKTPRSGASVVLAQSSRVVARKAMPKVLASSAWSLQSSRPGRSGTGSFFRTSVSIVPVPPALQLPSPPQQRKYPSSTVTPPTTVPPEMVASNTTSPASMMTADENFLRNPGPAGDGSPVTADGDLLERRRLGAARAQAEDQGEDQPHPSIHLRTLLREPSCATPRFARLSRWHG